MAESVKAAAEKPNDSILGGLSRDFFPIVILGFVLAATVTLLTTDFLEMRRGAPANELDRRSGPVVVPPPRDGDQVRPYLRRARPVAPGREPPPGVRVPSNGSPMTFTLAGGKLFAEGMITAGTFAEFERTIDGLPEDVVRKGMEVVLHSPGGVVQEALGLAERLRKEGMHTRVRADAYCASSCPIVFASGVKRIAEDNSWIGVHRVYVDPGIFGSLDEGVGQAQQVAAEVQQTLDDFGVDPLVWTHAMRTPKESLYFFTADELTDLKLATRVE